MRDGLKLPFYTWNHFHISRNRTSHFYPFLRFRKSSTSAFIEPTISVSRRLEMLAVSPILAYMLWCKKNDRAAQRKARDLNMPSENISSDWWALLLWSWTMHKTVLKALTRSTPRPWRRHRPYFLAGVVWCKDSRILLVGSKWLCQTIFKARVSMSFFLDCIHFLLEWKRVLVRTDCTHTQ